MPRSSKLKTALERALDEPSIAARCVHDVADEPVETAEEARLVVSLLDRFPLPLEPGDRVAASPLHDVMGWMQQAEADDVVAIFRQDGAPRLLRVFDDGLRTLAGSDDRAQLCSDLMFVLKVVCMYVAPGGLARIIDAARSPLLHDDFLWPMVLGIGGSDAHPWRADLVAALRDPLPEAFAGVAYLHLANAIARTGALDRHPFDTTQGHERLERWLLDPDAAHHPYAQTAAAALPFLGDATHAKLAALAERHPAANVRLEAARVAALRGNDAGVRLLQEACADFRHARAAMRYLEELDKSDRIPAQSRSPDFAALAEMHEWLAHPLGLGRPPTVLAQADTRELFWPPTGDRRQLWLFRYEYAPDLGETEPVIGYGMVGSVTDALFVRPTAELTPAQVYGLHCAWELKEHGDPRAPEEPSVEVGMRLLAEHNADFGR